MQQDTITTATVQNESMDTTVIDSLNFAAVGRVDSLLSDSGQVINADSLLIDSLYLDSLYLDSLYLDSIYKDSLEQVQLADTVAVEPEPMGMVGESWSSSLHRSNPVIVLSLLSVFLMLFVVGQIRHDLGERFSAFFFPKGVGGNDEGSYKNHPLLKPSIMLLLVSECTLLFMEYTSDRTDILAHSFCGIPLFYVCLLATTVYLLVKLAQYAFVNNLFFHRTARDRWRENYMLLMIIEGVALLPITLVYVFAGINSEIAYIGLAVVLLFVKILLLLKTFSVFFVKIVSSLHLIVYFCALEIIPALVWWVFLSWITQLATV